MPVNQIQEVNSEHLFYSREDVNSSPDRSKGIHISSIISNLYYIQMKRYKTQDISEAAAIVEAGFSWEELLEHAWAYREMERLKVLEGVERPGEVGYDGVFMTPDGFHRENKEVHELKLTTKSASKLHEFEENFINYIWQAAAYCLALECTKAVFWIIFIGRAQLNKEDDWKPARVYRVEYQFTEEDLDKHWKTLMQHKDWMIKEGLIEV